MLLRLLLLLIPFSLFAADFGDIPANLPMSPSQSVRRNAGDSAFEAYTATVQTHSVTLVTNGSGIVVSSGNKEPTKTLFGGTLIGWTMMCNPSGSVTADILRSNNTTGLPASSIVGGGTKPSISSNVENTSTSFSGWTSTTIAANDNLSMSLSGISVATYVTLTLYFQ